MYVYIYIYVPQLHHIFIVYLVLVLVRICEDAPPSDVTVVNSKSASAVVNLSSHHVEKAWKHERNMSSLMYYI